MSIASLNNLLSQSFQSKEDINEFLNVLSNSNLNSDIQNRLIQELNNNPQNETSLDILDMIFRFNSERSENNELILSLSSEPFTTSFLNLLKSRTNAGLNVQKKTIYLVKKWFNLYKGKYNGNFEGMYNNLKQNGLTFPPDSFTLETYTKFISESDLANFKGQDTFVNVFKDISFPEDKIGNENKSNLKSAVPDEEEFPMKNNFDNNSAKFPNFNNPIKSDYNQNNNNIYTQNNDQHNNQYNNNINEDGFPRQNDYSNNNNNINNNVINNNIINDDGFPRSDNNNDGFPRNNDSFNTFGNISNHFSDNKINDLNKERNSNFSNNNYNDGFPRSNGDQNNYGFNPYISNNANNNNSNPYSALSDFGNNNYDNYNNHNNYSNYHGDYSMDKESFKNKWIPKIKELNEWIDQGKFSFYSKKLTDGVRELVDDLDKVDSMITDCSFNRDFEGSRTLANLKADMEQTCFRYDCLMHDRTVDKFFSSFSGNRKRYQVNRSSLFRDNTNYTPFHGYSHDNSQFSNYNEFANTMDRIGSGIKKGAITVGTAVSGAAKKGYNFIKNKLSDDN